MSQHPARLAVSVLFLTACGAPSEMPTEPDRVRSLPQPMLRTVAPSQITAGEQVTIMGAGFADREVGETRVQFVGTFQSTSGKTNPVKLEVQPRYVNQGVLQWTFGPNIPFAATDETGTFRGTLQAVNVGIDGSVKPAATAIPVEMRVLPSIIIKQMRPLSAGCSVGITETIENTPFVFELAVVGLKEGTSVAPLRFVYTFLKENFQFKGYLNNQLGADPEALFPQKGPVSVVDDVTTGSSSQLGSAPRKINVVQGEFSPALTNLTTATDRLFNLTQLQTATAGAGGNRFDAVLNVVAIDSTGQSTRRSIPLRVWSPVEVEYQGHAQIMRSFDPVPVTGCIPGGDIGRDVTYTEQTAESRRRSFTVNARVGGGIELPVVKLNAEFGMDVQAEVSSSKSKDLAIAAKILPKEYGAFYRQTLQVERRAKLIGHGACGGTTDLGEVVVTDWVWSPDLGKGRTCPPMPKSNLPAGQVFKRVD